MCITGHAWENDLLRIKESDICNPSRSGSISPSLPPGEGMLIVKGGTPGVPRFSKIASPPPMACNANGGGDKGVGANKVVKMQMSEVCPNLRFPDFFR